jgi:hypothetical protein
LYNKRIHQKVRVYKTNQKAGYKKNNAKKKARNVRKFQHASNKNSLDPGLPGGFDKKPGHFDFSKKQNVFEL